MKLTSLWRVVAVFAMLLCSSAQAQTEQVLAMIYLQSKARGEQLLRQEDYRSAILLFSSALKHVKSTGKTALDYAEISDKMAYCYYELKEYAKSAELYEQVIDIYKQNGKHPGEYIVELGNLATCYGNLGEFVKSAALYEQIAVLCRDIVGKNHAYYASILNCLAWCYSEMGKYTKAIELYKQAQAIYKKVSVEKSRDYAISLYNMASCYYNLGDFAKAVELNKQALAIIKNISGEDSVDYARLISNFALCNIQFGEYVKSIELSKHALRIYKKTIGEECTDYAMSLNNLVYAHIAIGDYTKALEFNKQGLEILKKCLGGKHPLYAESLAAQAMIFAYAGDNAKAVELYKQALGIIKEDNPGYAKFLNNIAGCYTLLGNYKASSKICMQAMDIHKERVGENHHSYATAMNNLALNYDKLGNYSKAAKLYLQALGIYKNIYGEGYPHWLNNLAYSYYYDNNFRKIPPVWQESFDIEKKLLRSQFKTMTEVQRASFGGLITNHVISTNNSFATLSEKYPEAAKTSYNSLLFTKGLILSASIEFDNVIRESGNEELLKAFEELRTTRAILNTYYNKPIAERPEGETERLEKRADELEQKLIAGSKEYRDFTEYLNVEWQNVRDALGDKEVAIEFLAAENLLDNKTAPYYGALVLRKGWEAPKFVELTKAEPLKKFYKKHSAKLQGVESPMANIYSKEPAMELYTMIWSKLEPYINQGDKVFFAADGLLHQINIELLRDSENKRVNEKYSLYRVSSTREVYLDKPVIEKNSATLYGGLQYDVNIDTFKAESEKHQHDSEKKVYGFKASDAVRGLDSLTTLPATKDEIENIAKTCKKRKVEPEIYSATIGNEESFKALSGKKTPILHIATHGFFLENEEVDNKAAFLQMQLGNNGPSKPDNSLKRSGLIFAGAQRAWSGQEVPENVDDGILLAEEIATMDLSGTDLVVLSACETGLGEITSEGVFGLQRAFKKAGVKTLIMSLWKVHDKATSIFMQAFYKHWLAGDSKHDAFAKAQKAVREDKNHSFAHPRYWAAFIMLDDYEK